MVSLSASLYLCLSLCLCISTSIYFCINTWYVVFGTSRKKRPAGLRPLRHSGRPHPEAYLGRCGDAAGAEPGPGECLVQASSIASNTMVPSCKHDYSIELFPSNIPQDDIGTYLCLHILVWLFRSAPAACSCWPFAGSTLNLQS